jgi:Bifunctional DNA primase/polymerase, N-terminal/Primase C terminal 2 (PriCT-2)
MAESPSGSPHYYFKWPPNVIIRNHSSKIGLGIDQLGEGGMVIAPPSVRPGEGVYRWLNAAPIADAPQWLIDLATADDGDEERTPNDEPEADPDKIAAAFAIIPNNDAGFDVLNDLGMAAWRATRGSEAGFQPWAGWCAKSPKFGHLTAERRKQWRDYSKYPPNRIGAGTIFYHADQAQPGWSEQYDNAAMDKATQESLAGVDAFIAGLHGEKPEQRRAVARCNRAGGRSKITIARGYSDRAPASGKGATRPGAPDVHGEQRTDARRSVGEFPAAGIAG